MKKKIEPLMNVKALYDHSEDGYPTKIRLAMSDGTIQSFIRQPPVTWRRWKPIAEIVAYPAQDEYQPRHLKKTGAAATAPGQVNE